MSIPPSSSSTNFICEAHEFLPELLPEVPPIRFLPPLTAWKPRNDAQMPAWQLPASLLGDCGAPDQTFAFGGSSHSMEILGQIHWQYDNSCILL